MNNTNVIKKTREYSVPKLSFGVQTIAMVTALFSAILLPQLLHMLGKTLGQGSSLGEMLLPMHLPVLFVGILAGPYAGAVAGLFAPIISYALTGMPAMAMLPFITIELFAYGLFSGLIRNSKMPVIAMVLVAQVAGRVVRAIAILLAVKVLAVSTVATSVILTSIKTGIAGIVLQLLLIPIIMYAVRKAKKDDN